MLPQRPRGSPPHWLTRSNDLRREDAASRPENGARFDPRLVSDAHLPAYYGIISDTHAPRKPRLRRNHHVPADITVVPDVDHVVELRSLADPCHPERRPVHT